MPQAVQGAQAQPKGPGSDPNIKSEFGKLFQGLGGGLSSVLTGNGVSTPSRQSPMPHNRAESMPVGDHIDTVLARTTSLPGRKPKRLKDEDMNMDVEGAEGGRGTPLGMRGNKRQKHGFPGHHHHHHPHQ